MTFEEAERRALECVVDHKLWRDPIASEEAAELAALQADRAYNAFKNSGRLQQLEANRALAEQLKWGG